MNRSTGAKNFLHSFLVRYLALALMLVVLLLIAGIPVSSSLIATFFIFAYSAPLFLLTTHVREPRVEFFQSSLFSLSATSVTAALLFGFTQISSHIYLIWFGSIFALIAALFIGRSSILRKTKVPLSSHFKLEFGSMFVALTLGVLLFRSTFSFDELDPDWLPDDFPFFALLAESVSGGEPSTGFFSGMTINYHWLTYAFFGGLNRLAEIGQITGILVIGTIFSWMLLTLGSVSVVKAITKKPQAIVIAVFAVIFSNSVGLYVYSTSGLGGSIVSPSTLLTSSWFVASLLLVNHLMKFTPIPRMIFPVMLIIGFSLALGKVSTAAMAGIGIGVLLLHNFIFHRGDKKLEFRKLGLNTFLVLVPFAIGIGLVSQFFLKSTETEMGMEASLFSSSATGAYQWAVLVMPVMASLFSFAVMLFPTLISRPLWKSSGLFAASAVLAFTGILIILIFDFGSGNEAWFLTASFALILPTSSVAVANALSMEFGGTKAKCFLRFVLLFLFVTVTAIILVALRSLEYLVVRPWLTPTILITIGVTFAYLWTRIANHHHGSKVRRVTQLTAAYLFLLSLSFGFVIRIEAAFSETYSQDIFSMTRDIWIKQTYEKSLESRVLFRGQPVAIYSDSPGEATLTRWIPYFLDTEAYVISVDDELPDYYTPTNEDTRRQNIVRSYVDTGDLQACRELKNDGIQTVWLTQGIDFSSAKQNIAMIPKLLSVTCEWETPLGK